ncbi:MAG: hypothetical protein COA82_03510 [Alkaliphilus sp.]|nr:MAG: hypothetical protein COA82_03510 [Alkaliphilus sp.]
MSKKVEIYTVDYLEQVKALTQKEKEHSVRYFKYLENLAKRYDIKIVLNPDGPEHAADKCITCDNLVPNVDFVHGGRYVKSRLCNTCFKVLVRMQFSKDADFDIEKFKEYLCEFMIGHKVGHTSNGTLIFEVGFVDKLQPQGIAWAPLKETILYYQVSQKSK